jgi:hypothetical protein
VALVDAAGEKLATCRDRAVADEILAAVNGEPAGGPKYPPEFESLWRAWPRRGRVKKGDASRAYKTLAGSRPPLAELLGAVAILKRSARWREEDGRFIPHLGTALRAHYWNDAEVEEELEREQVAAERPRARSCVRCVLLGREDVRLAVAALPRAVEVEEAGGQGWGAGAPMCAECVAELDSIS